MDMHEFYMGNVFDAYEFSALTPTPTALFSAPLHPQLRG